MQFVEPSNYEDPDGDIRYYKWIKGPQDTNIAILPDFIFNFITSKERNTFLIDTLPSTQTVNDTTLDTTNTDLNSIQITEHDKNTYQEWLNIGRLIKFLPGLAEPLHVWIFISTKTDL